MLKFYTIGLLYKNILKKILFLMDPEKVHDSMISFGKFLGKYSFSKLLTKKVFLYKHKSLNNTVDGVFYENPIGLAAGFDKNAELTDILPLVGFGFEEVGSITNKYCRGNEKPRLWRLPKSKSLVVNYGLKNNGAKKINTELSKKKFNFPIGISIAKTNCKETADTNEGILDYKRTFEIFADNKVGDYITLNISCPNAFGGEPFTDPKKLDALLFSLSEIDCKKPIYIKLPAELPPGQIDEILSVVEKYKIAGFICTNLAKKREQNKIFDSKIPEKGGMSGKIVEDLSNDLIKYLYKKTKNKYTIIGCGGVFTAEDAYKKIKLGASLIQLITGMIYGGPQTISEINYNLVKILKRDGYKTINQAIGIENK